VKTRIITNPTNRFIVVTDRSLFCHQALFCAASSQRKLGKCSWVQLGTSLRYKTDLVTTLDMVHPGSRSPRDTARIHDTLSSLGGFSLFLKKAIALINTKIGSWFAISKWIYCRRDIFNDRESFMHIENDERLARWLFAANKSITGKRSNVK